MKLLLSGILLSLSILNSAYAGPFIRPKPPQETPTTETKNAQIPDPKKLNEAAAVVTALKHCLAMDGSLNQQPRLIDAYNNQPDLEHLPPDLSNEEREKTLLYTMGRPDIPDFGFLVADIWRTAPRDTRIKFNTIISLKLSESLGFRYGALAFEGNCKPVLMGDVYGRGNFEHAAVTMKLAFDNKETKLTYLLIKQKGYNWQIEDLLIDNNRISNYIGKDLVKSITDNGIAQTTKDLCKSSGFGTLKCN